MKTVETLGKSLATMAAGAAIAVAGIQYGTHSAAVATPAVQSTEGFAYAFRDVAKKTLPSIVSIRTLSKAHTVETGGTGGGGLDEMMLPDIFKSDPRLQELFRNQGRGGRRNVPAQRGMGSGFIIDSSGLVMTNNHVVDGADEVVVTLQDGREFIAKDIRTDPRTDVAVLRIDATNLPALRLGNSDESQVGDWVMAIGSPFGLDTSVTAGIVSGKGRGMGLTDREDFIQTDAAVNPGNSGGPLINLQGEVIGINTAISSRSGGYDGVSFAVPINMAQWVSKQLVNGGTVHRAYLGTMIQPVTHELAGQFQATAGKGVLVRKVMPGSPAEKAHLEPGDVILSVNGVGVNDPRSLQSAVEQLPIGKTFPLVVLREGKEVNLSIETQEMPEKVAKGQNEESPAKPKGEAFENLGLTVKPLTADEAKKLGQAQGGIVVAQVDDDSPAAAAGIQPGDVIERVGNAPVSTVENFRDQLKSSWSDAKGVILHLRNSEGKRFVLVKPNAE